MKTQRVRVAMHPLTRQGVGARVGYVYLEDTPAGLLIRPDLRDLPRYGVAPGYRGFHIHEHGNLDPKRKKGKRVAGGSAGAHYDPDHTDSHEGPYGNGHRGDLPALPVLPDGTARTPLLAPRLNLREVMNRALIIHAGPDNYTNDPPNGGGAVRALGGVITNDCPYCKGSTVRNPTYCPPATQDIKLNTRNRDRAIKFFDYGPPNPTLPSRWFWRKLASRWSRKPTREQIDEAKTMRCGNCGVFDVSPAMRRCMPRGYGLDAYEEAAMKAGAVLGYCWAHRFKCASTRTCATWVQGPAIRTDKASPLSKMRA